MYQLVGQLVLANHQPGLESSDPLAAQMLPTLV